MIDLNSKSSIADYVSQRMDAAREEHEGREPRRKYLGCSYLGEECERKIQFTYLAQASFPGQLLRIFDRGRWAEDYITLWLKRAGFALITEDAATGGQFEVSFMNGQVKGHADGIIAGGLRSQLPFPVPALWECKCLGDKSFKDLVKNKLRKSKPTYYGQVQLYMRGLKLSHCLFTAMNGNTMALHHELVEYDEEAAGELMGKAGRLLMYCDAGELVPRSFAVTDYRCKYCDWKDKCWQDQ